MRLVRRALAFYVASRVFVVASVVSLLILLAELGSLARRSLARQTPPARVAIVAQKLCQPLIKILKSGAALIPIALAKTRRVGILLRRLLRKLRAISFKAGFALV